MFLSLRVRRSCSAAAGSHAEHQLSRGFLGRELKKKQLVIAGKEKRKEKEGTSASLRGDTMKKSTSVRRTDLRSVESSTSNRFPRVETESREIISGLDEK